ncbi:MAG: TIM barrel protein [Candidatus Micrarchaeia archaeon]|jgi:deoxyribonuclease-4
MIFGTAGIPLSCAERDSRAGIAFVRKLGLDAFEFEFVHSARMAQDKVIECGKAAKENRIVLSAHAPYYVNLCSGEPEKVAASKVRILDTARILENSGGGRIVVHSGYYGKLDKKAAFEIVKNGYLDVLDSMKREGITKAILAPETTGKPSAFGNLEELYGLASEIGFERFKPTIDFAHLHARANGALNSKKDFDRIFETITGLVGKEGPRQLHCHFAGIQYSAKGELRHLTIDAKSPDFSLLAQSLVGNKCSGTIISESPNIETDALTMKKEYEKALG